MAMKKINISNFRFQIVVDANNKLLGTISDGDIRRSILNGVDLDDCVLKCMNNKPKINSIFTPARFFYFIYNINL